MPTEDSGMDKYGVELDVEKVKEAVERSQNEQIKDATKNLRRCPLCNKFLDSGGACPEHGTEPLEKRR